MTNPYVLAQSENAQDRRERLILEQLPQVHLIARRIHERLPDSVCLDDLVSTGIVGLISAVDNFEEVQGVKLKTYAEYKIRGAILDSLRGLDWASRHRRKKAKHIEAAIASAEHKLQRAATEDEVAAELDMTLDEYHARLVEVQGLNLESLEVPIGPSGNQTLLSMVPDTADDLPSGIWERAELERLLAEAIAAMPEKGTYRVGVVLPRRTHPPRDWRSDGLAHLPCGGTQNPFDPSLARSHEEAVAHHPRNLK
jgi:RNA polymerase sigma factor for flagellar operon FliA